MRYFLTGATGFIGNRLARLLLQEGHEVVALVRTPHKARDLKDLGATIVQGDITRRETLMTGMEGADGLFHVAAKYAFGRRSHSDMETVNVVGTRNVLRTMNELHISKGVYTSSIVINSDTRGHLVDETYYHEGPHLSTYAETKWKAHYDVAKSMIYDGLPLVIVQPSTVYGPGDDSVIASMFTDFLRRRLPFTPSHAEVSWAYVDDVVMGHYRAMQKGRPGESYILAGPTHSFLEAFDEAARITRRKPPPIRVGPGLILLSARLTGLVEHAISIPMHLTAEALRVTAGCTLIASYEKARRELGYEPRSLHQGLKGTLTDLAARIAEQKMKPSNKR